jgi:hypothetical protein
MNDYELITTVRTSVTGVHTTTPVEQIVRRGQAVRARRRIPGAAGVLALAGVAVLGVTQLVPGGHQAVQPGAQLAAWTVTKQADGNVSVTIRQLRDPAGLQRTLRADGIPANVRFFPSRDEGNPCQGYDGSPGLQDKVLQLLHPGHHGEQSTFLIIHPSALPSGAGVGLQVSGNAGYVNRPGGGRLGVALVQSSAACTGT